MEGVIVDGCSDIWIYNHLHATSNQYVDNYHKESFAIRLGLRLMKNISKN